MEHLLPKPVRSNEDYIREEYGSDMFAKKTNFAGGAEFYPQYSYGECYRDQECELLTVNMAVDPTTLPYEQKMRYYLKDFCYSTSAHGIPMIGSAQNNYSRTFWLLLYLTSITIFAYQGKSIIDKYNLKEKIVDIQLVFDAAPFPAITLCNLNPYKKSLANDVDLVRRMLKVFNDVMNAAADLSRGNVTEEYEEDYEDDYAFDDDGTRRMRRAVVLNNIVTNNVTTTDRPTRSTTLSTQQLRRRRKRAEQMTVEPAMSVCECEGLDECSVENLKNVTYSEEDGHELCLCAFDRVIGDAYPCYPAEKWTYLDDTPVVCDSCDDHGNCYREASDDFPDAFTDECICQSVNMYCIIRKMDIFSGEILNLWDYYNPKYIEPTESAEFLEALGFAGMTDEVAIVTKAKENIVFAMATLSMESRKQLSNQKHEFVQKCSFNGGGCNIDEDFVTHVDPVFGNCFTFNHDRAVNVTSIRAGPMYGLRLIVYVNASEYLPTTEASGIKMTIHEKYEHPFPDTFGYNAPVGYISSFGIKLKRMERLAAPFGDCAVDGRTKDYIFEEYEYTTEGCFRTCFQNLVLSQCDCGDPRFPVVADGKHCYAINATARNCLNKVTQSLGGLHGSFKCLCQQPCRSSSYSVSYSASVWPSESLQVQLGLCEGTPKECVQHYKENGAMIEVFFEQLNYEMLHESEAYGAVNLLSDFGGQLGLWLGVSVITLFEFLSIISKLSYVSGQHHYDDHMAEKRRKEGRTRKANS